VHMFAYKNGYLYWGINGSWYPTGANPATDTSPLNASQITAQQYALCGGYTGVTKSINFGQRPFKYTPPAGYLKLNTYNLPDSTIVDGSQYMNTVLYTGNGTSQDITVGFEPEAFWVKNRTNAYNHAWSNFVTDTYLYPNLTNVEGPNGSSINQLSDGFNLNTSSNVYNASGNSYVSWNWRGSDSSPVTNTDGTITSTVSANPTSGFSVVSWVGNATAGATIGHGLGVAPNVVILKNRDLSNPWVVYHSSNTSAPETDYLVLNTTAATVDNSVIWNDTAPTSNVFTVGSSATMNGNGNDIITYCFADVEGFSKFGSYIGNGSSDGPFVYTGFRPAWVMFKRTDSTSNWIIFDQERGLYNLNDNYLYANAAGAEGTSASSGVDLLSNGFKQRNTYADANTSSGTYIYMAFAENPFKNSLAR